MIKIYWDEASETLRYQESTKEEFDKRYENRTDKPVFWLNDDRKLDERMDRIYYDIRSGVIEIIKCKDCGHDFLLTRKNIEWYDENGYDHPKRCMACRKKRKEAKEKSDKKFDNDSRRLRNKREN